jgi:hypothetical protein
MVYVDMSILMASVRDVDPVYLYYRTLGFGLGYFFCWFRLLAFSVLFSLAFVISYPMLFCLSSMPPRA